MRFTEEQIKILESLNPKYIHSTGGYHNHLCWHIIDDKICVVYFYKNDGTVKERDEAYIRRSDISFEELVEIIKSPLIVFSTEVITKYKKIKEMIGIQISPILTEIESALFEYEANNGAKTEYTMDGFRAGTKIFMSVLMDKIWELQSSEGIEMEDRCKMVMKAGQEIRDLIKKYTDIDTHDLYKTPTKL